MLMIEKMLSQPFPGSTDSIKKEALLSVGTVPNEGRFAKVLWGLNGGQLVIKLIHLGDTVPVIAVRQKAMQENGRSDKVCVSCNEKVAIGALY